MCRVLCAVRMRTISQTIKNSIKQKNKIVFKLSNVIYYVYPLPPPLFLKHRTFTRAFGRIEFRRIHRGVLQYHATRPVPVSTLDRSRVPRVKVSVEVNWFGLSSKFRTWRIYTTATRPETKNVCTSKSAFRCVNNRPRHWRYPGGVERWVCVYMYIHIVIRIGNVR